MRDAVTFEKRGIPTVVVAHDRFETAARNQAKAVGLSELHLAIIKHPRPWHTDTDRQKEVESLMPAVVAGLTQGKPMPVT